MASFNLVLKIDMETLSNLESFVRSAESGSFSAAARRLAMTPAAVSRNVAQLEQNLGVRLFQRSTRKLTLTEAGEHFLAAVRLGLDSIQSAIADVSTTAGQPAGSLKISVSLSFGLDYLLPLLPGFLKRYPAVVPDWHFDNRAVDLIGEGFDAAIGGGFELTPGLIARELFRAHLIVVASPSYLKDKIVPSHPSELVDYDSIVMRSAQTGRIRQRTLRTIAGEEYSTELTGTLVFNDPEAMTRAALLGLGIAIAPMPHLLQHLASGALVRILPDWYSDVGPISLYFSNQKLLPAKTRCFIDFVIQHCRDTDLASQMSAIKNRTGVLD